MDAAAMDICDATGTRDSQEEVLLSTSDLSVIGVRATLCAASSESLDAIKRQMAGSWPNMVLTPRDDIRAEDVVLSELLNKRGPAAWLTISADGLDESGADSARLLTRLVQDCCTCRTVLVLTAQSSFDLVLVPREACGEDGVAFAAFATRVDGIAFIARTIAAKQVAVVLDLDSTLLESEHLPVQPPEWRDLQWQSLSLTQQPSGVPVTSHICVLPGEPHHAEGVHAATWIWKGATHNYRVRQRLGWSHLRELLIRETSPGGKLSAYVLSLGRPLYIQTAWQILDPSGQIIPQHEYGRKVNSARPDGVCWVPEKTPCIGTGLRSIFAPDYNMRLGPVWCADDIPEVYTEKYRDSVYPVVPYKPVSNVPQQYDADGSVLREMGSLLVQYWEHCYGVDGQGGAVAQVAVAARSTLHQLSVVPLSAKEVVAGWPAGLFQGQGTVSSALSVQAFMQLQSAVLLNFMAPGASPDAEVAMPENDENLQQTKANAAAAKPHLAVPVERVLRPSSRQDTIGAAPSTAHQPSKPVAQLSASPNVMEASAATTALAAQQPAGALEGGWQQHVVAAAEAEDDVIISIVPCKGAEGSCQLMLGQGSSKPPSMAEQAAVDGACPISLVAEAAYLASSEVEDGEIVGELRQEASDENGQPGRKRNFASFAGLDTLLGPAAINM